RRLLSAYVVHVYARQPDDARRSFAGAARPSHASCASAAHAGAVYVVDRGNCPRLDDRRKGRGVTAPTVSFLDHVLREWRFAAQRTPLIIVLVGLASVLFNHLVLPLFPDRVIEFMERGFRLEDLSGVLALNDLMAVYFPTFFLGLTS